MAAPIEFCGIPGSGKSTLCAATVQQLRRQNRAVWDLRRLVSRQLRRRNSGWAAAALAAVLPGWREAVLGFQHSLEDSLHFAATHPEFAALIHRWLAEPGRSQFWRETVYRAVLISVYEFELAAATDRRVLFAENFAQRFFSLRGYGVSRSPQEDARQYAALMPRPAAVVWVNTPTELCGQRVRNRPRLPLLFQEESPERLIEFFEEGTRLLGTLTDALERQGVPVLRIAGEGDLHAGAQHVAKWLETFV